MTLTRFIVASLAIAFLCGQAALAREVLMVTASPSSPSPSLLVRFEGVDNDGVAFDLRRREAGTIATNTAPGDGGWVLIGPNVPSDGRSGSFLDTNIVEGIVYEYWVDKVTSSSSKGYGVGGVSIPAPEHRGTILLVVEEGLTNSLKAELGQLERDLVGDGWKVATSAVPRYDENPVDGAARLAQLYTVRSAISNLYFSAPGELKAAYLIGRVPVPYSLAVQEPSFASNIPPWPPDGHEGHAGCWPADLYYADIYQDYTNQNYVWQDDTRAWTNTTIPRCSTLPGDGKFDNYRTPTRLDVQIGRVDFSQMPGSPLSETELVRQYLNKAHRYRMGKIDMQRSAAISSPYASVRMTFPSWFGTNAYVTSTNLQADLQNTNGYYGIFANGAGGFTSVGTHYTSWDLININPKIFIHMAHGSYFGDWDSENNLLRAALAGSEGGLVSLDAMDFSYGTPLNPHYHVAPDWALCHMALGETVGYGVRHSMNETFTASWIYTTRPSSHFALLGDPALRLFPVETVPEVDAVAAGNDVVLTWQASPDTGVAGYHVYSSTNGVGGPYSKLTGTAVSGTAYTNSGALPGTVYYQIRAMKDELTGAGNYENTSLGVFAMQSSEATPYVSIQPVDSSASEVGPDSATVRFMRTGDTSSDLTVYFTTSGSAGVGDYSLNATNSVVIPGGASAVDLVLSPYADDDFEGTETAMIELTDDVSYQAGVYVVQAIDIADEDSVPPDPSDLTAEEINTNAVLRWADNSTNETRFIIERRNISGGAVTIVDNEDGTLVSKYPAEGQWETQAFENSYNGSCFGIKKNSGDFYVDYAVGSAVTGWHDLAWWHPSGSTGGDLTDSQYLYIHHAGGSNTVLINMQVNGATWKELGRYELDTNSYLRVEGTSTSYRWTIADALRIERPFLPVGEVAAGVTNWTDTTVGAGYSYEYRVSAAIANATSSPSDSATVVITGGGTNAVPTVDAGTADAITADQDLSLNGSADDPDDGPLALVATWFKYSGPGSVTFGDEHALSTTASFSTNGAYTLGLRATDGLATVTDTVAVTVNPAPVPGMGASNGTAFVWDEYTIGLWHFDGNAEDATTNHLDLVLINGATLATGGQATAWMASPSGSALRVDNYPQAATGTVSDALIFGSGAGRPITLEARMNIEAWGSNSVSYTMFGMEQNWDTHINLEQGTWSYPEGWVSGNRDEALVGEQVIGTYWSTGVWHHFMFTFDGTNEFTAYLDGVRIGNSINTEPNWGRFNNLMLIFGNFVGYMDEIRLSSTIRTFETGSGEEPPPEIPEIDSGTTYVLNGELQIGFTSQTGHQYGVDHRLDLLVGDWTELTNGLTGDGDPIVIEVPPLDAGGFYRIRAWRGP
ncbi:MAG: hypothetical protein KJ626_06590 [Verrucomicrobia bacterium]|nr:hypothetical protein [Verrucomicrobiota bacterium]